MDYLLKKFTKSMIFSWRHNSGIYSFPLRAIAGTCNTSHIKIYFYSLHTDCFMYVPSFFSNIALDLHFM